MDGAQAMRSTLTMVYYSETKRGEGETDMAEREDERG